MLCSGGLVLFLLKYVTLRYNLDNLIWSLSQYSSEEKGVKLLSRDYNLLLQLFACLSEPSCKFSAMKELLKIYIWTSSSYSLLTVNSGAERRLSEARQTVRLNKPEIMSFSVQLWPRWSPGAAMICFFQSSPVLSQISKFDINLNLISELPTKNDGVGQK